MPPGVGESPELLIGRLTLPERELPEEKLCIPGDVEMLELVGMIIVCGREDAICQSDADDWRWETARALPLVCNRECEVSPFDIANWRWGSAQGLCFQT